MDDQRRVAMVETKTRENGTVPATLVSLWRFQLDNHLGSAMVELDHQGSVISYEEYHPYGSTAFNAEVSPKRYRYTGKERDEETGLYYHGARYYAPWLGRWTAADPKGVGDGPNVYLYVGDNPILYLDPNGSEKSIFDTFKPGGAVFESVDSLFNKNESPITAAVLNNLADRGEGIIESVKQPIKETAEDLADIVYYSTHPTEPGAATKVENAVKRRVTAPIKQTIAAVEGFGQTVKRVGEAGGDIAYYSTHSEEPGSGAKIASAVTDVVLDAPTIVLTVQGGAALAKGAPTPGLKTPPKKAPASIAPKQPSGAPAAAKPRVAGPAPHPGRAAAESAEISKESIVRQLRKQGSPEAQATAKLIKRGEIDVQVEAAPPPGRPKGTLGEQPYGTNVAKVYKSSHTRGTTEAAGTVVHEGEHVLQKLTPQKYRQRHEVEAFSKQVKADPHFLQILKDLYGKNLSAQDVIQAHVAKHYKQVPK